MTKTTTLIAPVFVNREDEIKFVEDQIDILRTGGSVFKCLINIHGVIGIGKTWLVNRLRDRFKAKGVICALVDFANEKYHLPERGCIEVLVDIVADIYGQVDLKPTAFHKELRNYDAVLKETRDEKGEYKDDETSRFYRETQTEKVVTLFFDYVDKVLGIGPLTLFIDTAEEASKPAFDWLEQRILSPLMGKERILIVVASRIEMRWKRFEVRRRAQPYRVNPFGARETELQYPKYSRLAGKVRSLTFGHPYGNRAVVEKLQEIEAEENKEIDTRTFDDYRKSLIQELIATFIEPYVMKNVPDELKHAYRIIATLRQFDVSTLRHILGEFLPDIFTEKTGAYYVHLVGMMIDTTLVEWDFVHRGYALNKTIRRMLALNMRLCDPKKFATINERAASLYSDWIERTPENRSVFIIEKLYHEANKWNVNGMYGKGIAQNLTSELENYLERYGTDGDEALSLVTSLGEMLDQDDELREFTPHEPDCLVRVVKAFKKRTRFYH